MKIFSKVYLKDFLAYRVGGEVDKIYCPQDIDEVIDAVNEIYFSKKPLTIVGSGTNLLVRDGGVEGWVLYLGSKYFTQEPKILEEDSEFKIIRASAQTAKAKLLLWTINQNLSGLEFSAGIPGTLGGAVYMNAGTKWGVYADVIEAVEFFNPKLGKYILTKEKLGLGYRTHDEALFKEPYTVVLSVQIKLKKVINAEAIIEKCDEILKQRGAKQDLSAPNCGSVFKNPENSVKGAGRLIEATGLKGTKVGGAQISAKHANFLLNVGGATAKDLESLIVRAQNEVFKMSGVKLQTEVVVVGRP